MKPRAVVISGGVSAGKSTLAKQLKKVAHAELVQLESLVPRKPAARLASPAELQRSIHQLEKATSGRWVSECLNPYLFSDVKSKFFVLDSVTSVDQLPHLRRSGWDIIHVHLVASLKTLERRYCAKRANGGHAKFNEKMNAAAQRRQAGLSKIADIVIDTDRCSVDDSYARIMARLETRPATVLPLVDVIIGGQYGSEGKGNIANYLAPEYDVLVRVGGPNAGHKVYRYGDDPYTFQQLPSGAIANKDATLVVGAGAVLSLNALLREISELSISIDKLVIDPRAMIIEATDIEWEKVNLLKSISSTAQGVGYATARKIMHRWPNSDVRLAQDVSALKHYIGDSIEFYAQAFSEGKRIMLEGTQGTSLSIHHGHYPHVTSRVTTAAGCLAEAGIASRHVRRVLMVCRTFPIRVGNSITGNTSGFMHKQTSLKKIAERSGIPIRELKSTEKGSVSKRQRRIAEFDWAQLRRSLVLNGPTDLALTFVDYFDIANRAAFRYEQLSADTIRFVEELEKVGGVPVSMLSTAFNDRNIIDRRMW